MQGAEQKVLPALCCKEDKSVLHGTARTGAKIIGKDAADVKVRDRKQKPQTVIKKPKKEPMQDREIQKTIRIQDESMQRTGVKMRAAEGGTFCAFVPGAINEEEQGWC